jgi:hypothetical protein
LRLPLIDIRNRRLELTDSEMVLDPKGPSIIQGDRGFATRPKLLFDLLEPIAQYLPTKISLQGSDHDLGSTLLGDDQRQACSKAISEKRYLSEEELKGLEDGIGKGVVKGTVAACPVGSLAWNQTLIMQEGGTVPRVESGELSHLTITLIRRNNRKLINRSNIHTRPLGNI